MAATCQEHGQIGPFKVGKDAADDLSCRMESIGTEEYPKECHETERQEPRDSASETGAGYCIQPWLTEFVDTQRNAMAGAPNDEGPCRTMPQAAQEHRDHEINVLTHFALAVTA